MTRFHSEEIDTKAEEVISQNEFQDLIHTAVADSEFSVSIADPRLPDQPLIAVSKGFELLTGYRRDEILGVNCRFLSWPGELSEEYVAGLREAVETGAPFTAVLCNRRKSGEQFLNLLDLRGLTVARNTKSGQDLWFLVGIQADVTHMAAKDMPDNHLSELNEVARSIRRRLTERLSAMVISGAAASMWTLGREMELVERGGTVKDRWRICSKAKWRPGKQFLRPRADTLASLPSLNGFTSKSLDNFSVVSVPSPSSTFDSLPNIGTGGGTPRQAPAKPQAKEVPTTLPQKSPQPIALAQCAAAALQAGSLPLGLRDNQGQRLSRLHVLVSVLGAATLMSATYFINRRCQKSSA